ncbi:MAG TPA: hypothetical protein P5069_11775, partial [Candidatus Hydrogenedentes bacterium]|nr:hypothetical protein [Candidatus Hydrogenedentota bacterium]
PVAGSSVPAGSAVSFVLSKGPQPVEGEGEGEGEPIGPTVEEARQALANAFTAADSNGDDRISFEEAVLVLPALTRALFDQLDTNKDGYLDRLELGLPEVTTGCSCRKGALSPSNIAQSLGDLFLGGLALLLLTALGRRRAG